MKPQTFILSALALSTLALIPTFALPTSVQKPGGQEERSELSQSMQDLNRGLRELRSALKGEDLMLAKIPDVVALQATALAAKEHLPVIITSLTDEKKKAIETAAYRTDMNAFLRGLLDVEDAFLIGDAAKGKAALQDLEKLKRVSHPRFQGQPGGKR